VVYAYKLAAQDWRGAGGFRRGGLWREAPHNASIQAALWASTMVQRFPNSFPFLVREAMTSSSRGEKITVSATEEGQATGRGIVSNTSWRTVGAPPTCDGEDQEE